MIGSLGEPDVTFIVVSCSRCSLPFSLFAKFIFGQVAGDQFRVPSTTDTRERETEIESWVRFIPFGGSG